MASHLTTHLPTSPLKGLRRIFPRDVRQLTRASSLCVSRAIASFFLYCTGTSAEWVCEFAGRTVENGALNCDDKCILIGWKFACSLLVFSPEPRGNRFFDVGQRFLFCLPLRKAARKCRTFCDDPTFFILLQDHMEHHGELPRQTVRAYIFIPHGALPIQPLRREQVAAGCGSHASPI